MNGGLLPYKLRKHSSLTCALADNRKVSLAPHPSLTSKLSEKKLRLEIKVQSSISQCPRGFQKPIKSV